MEPLPTLEIRDLHVSVEEKAILKGVTLTVRGGEVHAVMGPNGAGKSTLAEALAGHPSYRVTRGEALLDGEDLLAMRPDQRARAGLFLAFQYPTEVPGVTNVNFLRTAVNARREKPYTVMEFYRLLQEKMRQLEMDPSFANRYLNEGFSGGEKKRNEILQMALLEPKIAILDETDSGLDIDALRIVSQGVNALRGPQLGILLITHYQRILRYIEPDVVHVMVDGRIVLSGGRELADRLEERGYGWIEEQYATPAAEGGAGAEEGRA
ncbi:MAG: Fe-S cluster assembly ATPase SufC [Clostridia bacterium]|nr:Fe-S cluster assembly ATPase SufC [Clostridia bacterium]MCL6520751.1 Fe-S cluster assembly ATPase SufC [Bacillota bacterium]